MRILTTLFITIAAVTVFSTASVRATSESGAKCAMPTYEQAYKNAKRVFSGKATSVRTIGDKRIYTFQVDRYWKGGRAKTLEVVFFETLTYQVMLQLGEKYLVFAQADEDGSLYDVKCTLTKEYSRSQAELKRLGKGKIVK